MRPLRRRYLEQMAERIDALEAILARLRQGHVRAEDRDSLIVHSHKLAGSGGLYGFDDITTRARTLEQALKANGNLPAQAVEQLAEPVVQACRDARSALDLTAPAVAPSLAEQRVAPFAKEAGPPGPTASAAAEPARLQPRKPTLLVVDDDVFMSDLLASLFADDANVLVETTAQGAHETMLKHQPELLILDDNLLGADTHDGLQLLERMQQHVSLRDIPTIMLTGAAQPADVMRGLAAGAADFVSKPFDARTLVAKVRHRLARLATTVVIADDDEFLRDLLAHRYRSQGYRVLTCSDGVALLDILQWRHVDLVLVEWLLPRIDGQTVVQRMQDNETQRNVPVIMLSTRRRGDDMMEAFEAGASDYVTKPVRIEELMARSQNLLSRRKVVSP